MGRARADRLPGRACATPGRASCAIDSASPRPCSIRRRSPSASQSLPPGINPWSGHAVAIASIDFVKRAEVLAAHRRRAARSGDRRRGASPHAGHGSRRGGLATRLTRAVVRAACRPRRIPAIAAAFEYLTVTSATRGDPIDDLPAATERRRPRRRHGARMSWRQADGSRSSRCFAAIEAIRARDLARPRTRGPRGPVDRDHDGAARRVVDMPAIERTLARRLAAARERGRSNRPSRSLPWEEDDRRRRRRAGCDAVGAGLESVDEERAALERLIALARRCASRLEDSPACAPARPSCASRP